jgi:glycosyltransferase involved in cell wall biosynthesis
MMPLYNKQEYVAAAIRSVLTQTFTRFELIIIDDGSTDRSAQIAEQMCRDDSRVRIIRQANAGVAKVRHRGLTEARGEFVANLDPDDIALPGWLAAEYEYLREHPECVLVGCRQLRICPMGLDLGESQPPALHEEIERILLSGRGDALGQTCSMMRRSVALEAGSYNTSGNYDDDLDLFLRMALRGRLANLQDVHVRYRQHAGSLTHSRKPEQMEHLLRVLQNAHSDRGIIIPWEALEAKITPFVPEPPDEYYRDWTWNALKHQQYRIAWFYILRSIASRPVSIANWHMLGSVVRRQLRRLFTLKHA